MIQRNEPEDLLEAHRHRKIRTFLASRSTTHDEEAAIWDFVGRHRPGMTMQLAEAVVRELEQSERTIGELLDGWIPTTLQEAPNNET